MNDFVTIKIIPADEETLTRYERRCEYNHMVQEFARCHKEVEAIQVTHDPQNRDYVVVFATVKK